MAVAVSLGATAFDFTSLVKEQQRLSKQLVMPVPRDQQDQTQTLKYFDGNQTFDAYIRVFEPNSADPSAKPTYRLYYRDNLNEERPLTSLANGHKLGNATVGAGGGQVVFDLESGTIQLQQGAGVTTVGSIQFEAAGGLTLASVNRRLADINAALEAMARVMQVANGSIEGVQGLLR